jgi:acyl-CoA reductase-like NAD-dependent aldehyde dehydrogenase
MSTLAALLTRETGKPISMSRSELQGLTRRIDLFPAESRPPRQRRRSLRRTDTRHAGPSQHQQRAVMGHQHVHR